MQSPRVCSRCGERDPMWSGLPSKGWEHVDGKLACTDCLWMTSGPRNAEPNFEAGRAAWLLSQITDAALELVSEHDWTVQQVTDKINAGVEETA